MPAARPTFTRAEIESHNSSKSCFMTINNKVYDVTDFVDDHPGGAELVLEYAGKDVAAILQDSDSHTHSEAAYEILDECFVGYVADKDISEKTNGPQGPDMIYENDRWVHSRTGMATEDDLSKDTDISDDYKKHKFLDLSKPLLMQVWFGGFSKRFYLEQVHRPRHYKGGVSAPLFGNFLEPLSLTPWYVVPIVWLPAVAYGLNTALQGESSLTIFKHWLFGFSLWSLIEYVLHRFLFHLDEWLPDNRVALTLHFLLHGVHHYLPMDKYRLVMPPALFVILATPFYRLSVAIFTYSWHSAVAVFCGGVFGYVCYDLTHYFLHHQNLPLWYKALKKYHLEHHFLDYENGFGVTTRFWDRVFGTELVEAGKKK
ncbi:fatty acid alpha-hydroxylase [Ceratocystis pirilliformis]|uniref:Ceramide very long chain fatty acid hydroxylase n=1 Tax=Ceratocystis pirilliformis TaxID=259994 RepID=A0ABR3YX62_9PEZI